MSLLPPVQIHPRFSGDRLHDEVLENGTGVREYGLMISDEIRQLLYARPFVPFEVHVAERKVLRVPHADYALINPMGTAMTIMDEHGVFNHVAIAHVTRVVPLEQQEAGSPQ